MRRTEVLEGVRLMKFRDVFGRCERRELGKLEAVELWGVSSGRWRTLPFEEQFAPVGGWSEAIPPSRCKACKQRSEQVEFAPLISPYGSLVVNPFEWRWSSIHHYVRRGIIAPDWFGRDQDGHFGDSAIPGLRCAPSGLRLLRCT